MKELIYKFQNPYNSCEEILYCKETGQYYNLLPCTPYSKTLCTCTPSQGYYEADCPVRSGLSYKIHGEVVTTETDGEIIDYAEKEKFENQEMVFYRMKPEFATLPDYEQFSDNRLFLKLYDYMDPNHFDKITRKRKEVYCIMACWYERRADQ